MPFSTRLHNLFGCAHSKNSYNGDAYTRAVGSPLSAHSVRELERLGLRQPVEVPELAGNTQADLPVESESIGPSEASQVMAMNHPSPPIPEHMCEAAPIVVPAPLPTNGPHTEVVSTPSNDSLLAKFGLREKQMPTDSGGLSLYRAVIDQQEQFYPRHDGALTEREVRDQAALRKTIAMSWNVPAPYVNIEERQLALSMQINLHMIARGVSYCLNKEAAKMGLPRLTIVRAVDREAGVLHYNSTAPR